MLSAGGPGAWALAPELAPAQRTALLEARGRYHAAAAEARRALRAALGGAAFACAPGADAAHLAARGRRSGRRRRRRARDGRARARRGDGGRGARSVSDPDAAPARRGAADGRPARRRGGRRGGGGGRALTPRRAPTRGGAL
jgi:hypothetical protein